MRRWLSATANAFKSAHQCGWHISNLRCRFITCLFLALKDMENVCGRSVCVVKKGYYILAFARSARAGITFARAGSTFARAGNTIARERNTFVREGSKDFLDLHPLSRCLCCLYSLSLDFYEWKVIIARCFVPGIQSK